jgi:lipoyl(octanoyl) transferase
MPSTNQKRAWIVDLGLLAYPQALELQHRLVAARNDHRLDRDVILVLEHPPVFTLGRRGGRENLRVDPVFLQRQNVPVIQVERGGFITYHGPGQLVIYPILDLKQARIGVAALVETLEEVMIQSAADFGVCASRDPRNRGVWVDNRKLGSIGIAVRRSVSFHGLALNVTNSLEPFDWIDPCGLYGVTMTSLQQAASAVIDFHSVRSRAIAHVQQLLAIQGERIDASGLKTLLEGQKESL